MNWKPVKEAPLGRIVMLWHRAWRCPYAGVRNGDNGEVYVYGLGSDGWQTHADWFALIEVPGGDVRESWATASLNAPVKQVPADHPNHRNFYGYRGTTLRG